jgi:hypothetical protein
MDEMKGEMNEMKNEASGMKNEANKMRGGVNKTSEVRGVRGNEVEKHSPIYTGSHVPGHKEVGIGALWALPSLPRGPGTCWE